MDKTWHAHILHLNHLTDDLLPPYRVCTSTHSWPSWGSCFHIFTWEGPLWYVRKMLRTFLPHINHRGSLRLELRLPYTECRSLYQGSPIIVVPELTLQSPQLLFITQFPMPWLPREAATPPTLGEQRLVQDIGVTVQTWESQKTPVVVVAAAAQNVDPQATGQKAAMPKSTAS